MPAWIMRVVLQEWLNMKSPSSSASKFAWYPVSFMDLSCRKVSRVSHATLQLGQVLKYAIIPSILGVLIIHGIASIRNKKILHNRAVGGIINGTIRDGENFCFIALCVYRKR